MQYAALSNTRTCTSAATTRTTIQAKSAVVHTFFSKACKGNLSCQLRSTRSSIRGLQAIPTKRRAVTRAIVAEIAEGFTADHGNVEQIESPEQFHDALKRAGDKLVVLDISTKTCGPCKFIYPHLVTMSKEQTDVVFLKIFGDLTPETRALMKEWGVRSVPTFNFYVKGEKVDAQGGANPEKLKVKIAEVKSKCVAA